MNIGLIIDIVLVFIVIFNIIYGRIKGMVKVLRGFLVPILAILMAISLNPAVTESIQGMSAFDKVEGKVAELVAEKLPNVGATSDVQNLSPEEKADLESLLTQFGISEEEKAAILNGTSEKNGKDVLLDLINHAIAKALAYVVVFVLSIIVLSILFAILGAIFRNALLRHADHVLGTVVGGLRGLLIVGVIVFLIDKASAFLFTIYPPIQGYLGQSSLFPLLVRFLNFLL